MKNKLITLGIGLVMFIVFVTVLALIISTEVGYLLLLAAAVLFASYAFGWIVREVWDMYKRDKANR